MSYALLHIPKTGGTALQAALLPRLDRCARPVRVCDHLPRMPDIVGGDNDTVSVIAFVRDPIDRFVSAFNSRKRQGRPRYDVPWSSVEAATFEAFDTANELAEALAASDSQRRNLARRSLRRVPHFRRTLAYYLQSPDYLEKWRHRIGFIGRQETLESDVARLSALLGLDGLPLPDDPVAAHKALPSDDRALSPLARRRLSRWFAEDYDILAWCENWRRETLGDAAAAPASSPASPAAGSKRARASS